ncbi:hypothetical protein GUJ93_ZPchr0008g12424 [Zizania palustris]|uniref:Uncharacterized protein n=1 Tax=Zizania palustris TaxID=103762 RepID=A0A8J5RA41_ZIZPA|nr:hypothetical protein GUJ93_ZPchr0008g12424 [Zizania palustris]
MSTSAQHPDGDLPLRLCPNSRVVSPYSRALSVAISPPRRQSPSVAISPPRRQSPPVAISPPCSVSRSLGRSPRRCGLGVGAAAAGEQIRPDDHRCRSGHQRGLGVGHRCRSNHQRGLRVRPPLQLHFFLHPPAVEGSTTAATRAEREWPKL